MRNLKQLGIGLFTLLLLPAGNTSAAAGEEQSVRDLVSRYATARQSLDARAIRALFTPDADQLVSSGEWRRGSEALVRGMLESSRSNSGARTIIVDTVRMLTPEVALADARYEIAATAGGETRRMWSTFFCVKQNGGWRIAAIRNMLPSK